jgi:hypothetical protein
MSAIMQTIWIHNLLHNTKLNDTATL